MAKVTVRLGSVGAWKLGMEFGALIVDDPEQIYRFGRAGGGDVAVGVGVVVSQPIDIDDPSIFSKPGALDGWLVDVDFANAVTLSTTTKVTITFSAGKCEKKIGPMTCNIYGVSLTPYKGSGKMIYYGSSVQADAFSKNDPRFPLP